MGKAAILSRLDDDDPQWFPSPYGELIAKESIWPDKFIHALNMFPSPYGELILKAEQVARLGNNLIA